MARQMTKAQARKRLVEANTKIVRVYMSTLKMKLRGDTSQVPLSTKDMEAIRKIILKALTRLR